ncbi:MAG: hypothetical protein ACW981_14160 [Candidatus Hodarchaeales archaeon]|jgi:hypothetical protein
MTYYNELRETLKQRAKPETQFEIFRNIHSETIKKLIDSFNCPEEEVLTTIYLSKFIITGDVTSHAGPQQRLNDDERVELILKNLIESKKYLGSMIGLDDRIFLMQLTWQISWEIDKSFQKNILTNSYPIDVLFCQVIDYLITPLLNEWYGVLKNYDLEKMDHRWILAEILASLTNDFPLEMMKPLEKEIRSSKITENEYFLSGWILCQEYINYLQVNEYIPTVLPASTHLHLNDPMTFAGSIIYRKSDSNVYPINDPQLLTSRGNFQLTKEKMHDIKNLLSLDHPALSSSRYLHKNSKFALRIEDEMGEKFQRHLYLFQHFDNDLDIGYWLILFIQSEDINQTQLQFIIQNRFSQIQSVLDLIGKDEVGKSFNVYWEDIIAVWIKTFVTDLQDESKYIGHVEDFQKSQKYMLMGISAINSKQSNHSFVYESIEDNARIDMKYSDSSSNKLFLDRANNLFSLSDILYLSGYNLAQFLLASEDKKVKSIRITPSSLFFYYEDNPVEHLLLLPMYTYNPDTKVHNLVSGILSNKPLADIAHIGKTFQSKRNIERSLRVVAESRANQSLFQLVKERISQTFPFPNLLRDTELSNKLNYTFEILKGKIIGDSIKKSVQKKIVTEEEKKEQARLKLLNNVIYYVIKELIIPYRLYVSEKDMLGKVQSLGNPQDVSTSVAIVERKIDVLKERLDQIPETYRELISRLSLTIEVANFNDFIENCKNQLLESWKDYPEYDLKDLLISI